jgi:hypothetical protein
MRDIYWHEVRIMRSKGIKVTHTALYEMQNCRDKSTFVIVKDHPTNPNAIMRVWPTKELAYD